MNTLDPTIFLPESISKETAEFNAGIHQLLSAVPPAYTLPPQQIRDDCEAAAVWLVENAAQVFGTDVLMIGGESAGANLSVVTLLRMRDSHGYHGFACANLAYGVFDLSMTPSVRGWGEAPNYIVTTRLTKWFSDNYASPEKWTDPDVSPLYADLSNLPPALFTIGTMDPLLDDSLFMHARWSAAGNPSELAVYPGGIHAFNTFPIKIASQANERIEEFINSIAG